jgi:hypothetical protein
VTPEASPFSNFYFSIFRQLRPQLAGGKALEGAKAFAKFGGG